MRILDNRVNWFMELVRIQDADDYGPAGRKSERIYVIARESGKVLD